jgi:hypothetical protein
VKVVACWDAAGKLTPAMPKAVSALASKALRKEAPRPYASLRTRTQFAIRNSLQLDKVIKKI